MIYSRVATLVSLMALMFNSLAAAGQDTPPADPNAQHGEVCSGVEAGTLVRLEIARGKGQGTSVPGTEEHLVTGTLESCSDNIWAVRPGESGTELVRVPREQILAVSVGDGVSSHQLAGGLIGMCVGGIAGAAIAASLDYESDPEVPLDGFRQMDNAIADGIALTVGGAVAGAIVGALIGSRIRSEKWKPLDIEAVDVSLAMSPTTDPGISLSIAF